MTEICVRKCAEDVPAGFDFSVYFFSVLPKHHPCIIGPSKCCGSVSVRDGCVVECDRGLCVAMSDPRYNLC